MKSAKSGRSRPTTPGNGRVTAGQDFIKRRASTQSLKLPGNCPDLIRFLTRRFTRVIDGPYTFEQLRTLDPLHLLVEKLKRSQQPYLVFAILYCKLQFAASAGSDDHSVDGSRGYACEIAAMRVLRTYDADRTLAALTHDFRAVPPVQDNSPDEHVPSSHHASNVVSQSQSQSQPLLHVDTHASYGSNPGPERVGDRDSLTALEVAIIADAKHFVASQACQDIVSQIWHGEVVFWNHISSTEHKHARYYDSTADSPFWNFARLRVPKYSFCLESLNFLVLLVLYLVVVCDREYAHLGTFEVVLGLWFLGFAYDEWDSLREAGQFALHFAQVWNFVDAAIVLVALAWIVLRCVGIARSDVELVAQSYDVLSLAAVMLVPRLFSFLSLNPWFGTLFPSLQRLSSDFVKFMVLVVALYGGFLTTFAILGRSDFKFGEIAWLLVRVFYGSSYLGFDVQSRIHPILGPPLMLVFVTFSQILLTTALISVLSNSFSLVMSNAREEYLFLRTVTTLEASKSDHTIKLLPPFNLLGLVLVRPLRLFLPSNHQLLREFKLAILKVTHAPFVVMLSLYERSPFAPKASEAANRRLMAQRYVERGLARAGRAGGDAKRMSRILRASLGPMLSVASPAVERSAYMQDEEDDYLSYEDEDDVDELEQNAEGLDTGVMLTNATGTSGKATDSSETAQRLQKLEKEIGELKAMLKAALDK